MPNLGINPNVLHSVNARIDAMCYWGMIRNDANPTDIREHLVSGEQTAISIRNPDMTRDHLAPPPKRETPISVAIFLKEYLKGLRSISWSL